MFTRTSTTLALCVLSTLLASACGFERGHAAVCVADSLSFQDPEDPENILIDRSGTVVSDEENPEGPDPSTFECDALASRFLTLEDANGEQLRLGYGWRDDDDTDITEPLPVSVGDSVELRYRELQSFGTASGFVLQDDDGLVAAVEVGTWGNALQDGDVPGLTVSSGAVYASAYTQCGTQEAHLTELQGDETIGLQALEKGDLQIGGASYTALPLANYGYSSTNCTDLAGASIWAVWRGAP